MWRKEAWVCLALVAFTQALNERETVDDFIINSVNAQNIRDNLRCVFNNDQQGRILAY